MASSTDRPSTVRSTDPNWIPSGLSIVMAYVADLNLYSIVKLFQLAGMQGSMNRRSPRC